jgi:hypothetical protein
MNDLQKIAGVGVIARGLALATLAVLRLALLPDYGLGGPGMTNDAASALAYAAVSPTLSIIGLLDMILAMARDYKPLTAFGLLGLTFIGCGMIPGLIVIREFVATGLVLRFPSAILAVGLVLTGLLIAFVGLVLHTIARRFQELDCQMRDLLDYQVKRVRS